VFRIVTQFVPRPPLPPLRQPELRQLGRPTARSDGGREPGSTRLPHRRLDKRLSIAIMGQLCPQHTEQVRQQQAAYIKAQEEKRTGGGVIGISRGPLVGANGKPV